MSKKNKKGLEKTGNRNNAKNNEQKVEKQQAMAFLHWEMLNKAGEVCLKDDKGIAIFQNPKYQSDAEDRLIQLAGSQENDEITVTMKVTIRLNKKKNIVAPVDDILAGLF